MQTSDFRQEGMMQQREFGSEAPRGTEESNEDQNILGVCGRKKGKFFYYDAPLSEETGAWIPVSVPPEQEEWSTGPVVDGGCFPNGDLGWNQFNGGSKEMTM